MLTNPLSPLSAHNTPQAANKVRPEPGQADPKESLAAWAPPDAQVYRRQPGLLHRLAMADPETPAPPGLAVAALAPITQEALESRGIKMGFSPEVLAHVASIGGPAPIHAPGVRDLRHLKWAAIDNKTTKDVDQLAYAEKLPDGKTRLLVAVADVAALVKKGDPVDQDALKNTTSVYTPGHVNSMLHENLSTNWTSLNQGEDRRAMVTELIVGADGRVESYEVYQAAVHNHAQTDYPTVAEWIGNCGPVPEALRDKPELQEQIRLQMETGRLLGDYRQSQGSLEFETRRLMTEVQDGRIVDLGTEQKNLANEGIANIMIAANSANSAWLHSQGYPVLLRALPRPDRWDRMREVAARAAGELPAGQEMPSELAILPEQPSSAALGTFLREYKARHPEGAEEVTLSMLKLMGGGDYVVAKPGEPLPGHFGQGIPDGTTGYLHSTAPNRRYPDIVVQRMLQAALRGEPCPYTVEELEAIAAQCNKMESAANGAERQVSKAAVAHYLGTQLGSEYDAVVTGRKESKGVFVKVIDPPIEGKLVAGTEGMDVGERLRVKLTAVDTEKGHIDFARIGEAAPSTAWNLAQ